MASRNALPEGHGSNPRLCGKSLRGRGAGLRPLVQHNLPKGHTGSEGFGGLHPDGKGPHAGGRAGPHQCPLPQGAGSTQPDGSAASSRQHGRTTTDMDDLVWMEMGGRGMRGSLHYVRWHPVQQVLRRDKVMAAEWHSIWGKWMRPGLVYVVLVISQINHFHWVGNTKPPCGFPLLVASQLGLWGDHGCTGLGVFLSHLNVSLKRLPEWKIGQPPSAQEAWWIGEDQTPSSARPTKRLKELLRETPGGWVGCFGCDWVTFVIYIYIYHTFYIRTYMVYVCTLYSMYMRIHTPKHTT